MAYGIVAKETVERPAQRHATQVDHERNDADQDPVAAELFLFRRRDAACGVTGANVEARKTPTEARGSKGGLCLS